MGTEQQFRRAFVLRRPRTAAFVVALPVIMSGVLPRFAISSMSSSAKRRCRRIYLRRCRCSRTLLNLLYPASISRTVLLRLRPRMALEPRLQMFRATNLSPLMPMHVAPMFCVASARGGFPGESTVPVVLHAIKRDSFIKCSVFLELASIVKARLPHISGDIVLQDATMLSIEDQINCALPPPKQIGFRDRLVRCIQHVCRDDGSASVHNVVFTFVHGYPQFLKDIGAPVGLRAYTVQRFIKYLVRLNFLLSIDCGTHTRGDLVRVNSKDFPEFAVQR